jgi:hypothetical protein
VTRELRIGLALLVALGAFTAVMIVVGSLGEPRAERDPLSVEEALDGADRWGSEELHVAGWYAELDGDCVGDTGGADPEVAWLQRDCPLRVLMPTQPAEDVTQEELLRDGLRLAAPLGNAFPSRAAPGGPNLRGQQLVFVGHFADAAAEDCVPDRVERCRNTLVVNDYDELVR